MTATPDRRTRPDRPAAPRRLASLEGLRGLAALYVVAFHAASWADWDGVPLEHRPSIGLGALAHGHAAVGVFIVLSGFCLMRPVVSADGTLAGGVRGYLGRRARRILPPYYAASLLSLVLIAAIPALRRPAGTAWDHCIPAFGSKTLAAHALLTHNLDLRHRLKINAPHWSVATEWQIYFALPVLVLAWRRFGIVAAVATASVAGLLPHLLLPPGRNYDTACPWYLGLFSLGMAAAVVEGSPGRDRWPWRAIAWLGAVGLAAILMNPQHGGVPGRGMIDRPGWFVYWGRPLWVRDAMVGLVTAAGIVALARGEARAARSPALSVLRSRPMLALGAMSYSLYLTHYPILALVHAGLGGGRSMGDAAWLLTLGIPASLVFARVFYAAIERRFAARRPVGPAARTFSRDAKMVRGGRYEDLIARG